MHRMVSILPLSSNPPLVSRLEILRKREDAWKRLEWKRRCALDRIPSNSTYVFVNGVFGYVSSHEDEYIQTIDFFELPSADSLSCEVTRAWTHHMGDLAAVNFAMDPAQDLLVLVATILDECVRIHIFCM
jgi:hypothetical protein